MSAGKVMRCMQYSEGVLLDLQPFASECLCRIIEPVGFSILQGNVTLFTGRREIPLRLGIH